jgi:hypothetical protein
MAVEMIKAALDDLDEHGPPDVFMSCDYPIGARIPEALYDRLEYASASFDIPMSKLVRALVGRLMR